MAVKLIAYGAYMFIMITSQTEKPVYDVAFFMVVYFIFTAIEIGFLYRQVNQWFSPLKKNKKFLCVP